MQIKLIYEALKFAEEKHKAQKRKVTGLPYITHPLIVSYIACHHKKSKHLHDLIIAAILHDTVEDTDTEHDEILMRFGMMVASLVHELTDDKEEIKRIGKLKYHRNKWAGISNYALYLKLCDRLANLSDKPTEEALLMTKEILLHLQKRRKLTKSHKSVIAEIKKLLP